MDHPVQVLRFVADAQSAGHGCALCIVAHVEGGTLRGKGAMMAVRDDGQARGYVSNGCVDADICLQAMEALKSGKGKRLRYGEGSPFKDITLPCGGSLDIVIIPNPEPAIIRTMVEALSLRRSANLIVAPDFVLTEDSQTCAIFEHLYAPPIQLRIAGRGDAVSALARQARSTGFDVIIQSPDPELLREMNGFDSDHLIDPAEIPARADDRWTAVVTLFHDHDWEPHILATALQGEAFYVGAMGSARTHQQRCDVLRLMGLPEAQLARISGPIGIIPAMRSANLLALSILAEIVSVAQAQGVLT